MSLEDICNKILSDARKEAEAIAAQGRLEKEKALASQAEVHRQALAAIKEETEKKVFQLKDQAAFRLRMAEKKTVLAAKQQAIDAVFAVAGAELAKAGSDEFVRIYARALKEAPVLAGAEAACSRARVPLAKKALAAAGLKYPLAAAFLSAGQEGIVLRSDTVEVSLTLEALLQQAREELMSDISVILFNK